MSVPELVIDTNVVLDAWVFRDPAAGALAGAVEAGRMRWVASSAMLQELRAVLARPPAERWATHFERALTSGLDSLAHEVEQLELGAAQRLHCSDPDDQKFIDLALARPVAALLTRDRALLKLARRARGRGVIVAPPAAWLRTIGL